MADKSARRLAPERKIPQSTPEASGTNILIAAMITLAGLCLMLIDSGLAGG